ncbi:P-loop containing nucleoside triphosphate hydrolase protein [Trametes sanguinea]|nr:P-loop containing nucleoside triphosphate hydrolase protein [Trametes sanguinea]
MQWRNALSSSAKRLPRHPTLVSFVHSDASALPIVNIPRASIYELGSHEPVLRNISWIVHPAESWAVMSDGAASSHLKLALFGALTGTHRISPPPPASQGGLFPFLGDADPHRYVQMVRFAHRGRASGDGFYDFTARYGAVREEDKRTLRETFFPDIARPLHELAVPSLVKPERDVDDLTAEDTEKREKARRKEEMFGLLTEWLQLGRLLDLPMIALSNGQTRRARIAQALLSDPKLLLLDEPLTGLDHKSRGVLVALLQELKKQKSSPHVIMGLRAQDPIPDWTSHVALIQDGGEVLTGRKEDVFPSRFTPALVQASVSSDDTSSRSHYRHRQHGDALVDMKGVTVQYGPRKVLSSVHWTIRANSRWHLIGENGAGKTTLLALLTGEHPQSYTQSSNLRLFDRERSRWATPLLHRRIGRVSPELYNAFPRRSELTVWDAIGTGFDGGFVPKGKRRVGVAHDGTSLSPGSHEEEWRIHRMHEVMRALGPRRWHAHPDKMTDEKFFAQSFPTLSPGEQSMVLLMRALVGAPPLVLLDEAWAGMDRAMVEAAHEYLRDGGGGLTEEQACVVVSHWEEEVPWGPEHGVQRFRLDGGQGEQIFPNPK